MKVAEPVGVIAGEMRALLGPLPGMLPSPLQCAGAGSRGKDWLMLLALLLAQSCAHSLLPHPPHTPAGVVPTTNPTSTAIFKAL